MHSIKLNGFCADAGSEKSFCRGCSNGFNILPTIERLSQHFYKLRRTKKKKPVSPIEMTSFEHACVLQMLNELMASTPSKIKSITNLRNVESMLNESLNQFKFDSTSFEHFLHVQQC